MLSGSQQALASPAFAPDWRKNTIAPDFITEIDNPRFLSAESRTAAECVEPSTRCIEPWEGSQSESFEHNAELVRPLTEIADAKC
jgi:hypothetical protein